LAQGAKAGKRPALKPVGSCAQLRASIAGLEKLLTVFVNDDERSVIFAERAEDTRPAKLKDFAPHA
jgi:hypothetical protein